ncbi:hypothetical protein A3759_03235 [Thalassolituus sp. HI0120]|jgi:hypothetical protein|nr:hypothetical protein A3759_29570 [Thalassolituus sp. HI0120]KZZ50936.1 hypothetical protein A3759_03235 [Thalassolituus sp. HI0120]
MIISGARLGHIYYQKGENAPNYTKNALKTGAYKTGTRFALHCSYEDLNLLNNVSTSVAPFK